MRASTVAMVLLSIVGTFAACTETTGPVSPPQPPRSGVVANPTCGKESDVVTLSMPEGSTCEVLNVRFHPGVKAESSAKKSDDGACVVTATVPAGASTGTVEVVEYRAGTIHNEQMFTTTAAFSVPCPPDAGPIEPDSGVPDSGEPPSPLNAVWVQRRFSDSTIVNTDGFTYASGMTPVQAAALAKREAIITSSLSPPGVALGTCAAVDLPDPGPDEPKPIYRGSFSVKAGASTVIDKINCGPDFHYRQTYPWASFYDGLDDDWDLDWEGDGSEQGFSITGGVGRIHPLLLTAPNPATPDVDIPQGAFTVTWSPTVVKLLALHFLQTSGVHFICAVDPKAGTFTVPANVIGGAGDVSMEVFAGDLRRRYITQLAHALMTLSVHHYELFLHVQ